MAAGRRTGPLLAVAAFLAWGFLSPGNAILLEEMGPLWMQATRAVLAVAVLALWLGPRRMHEGVRLLRRPMLLLAFALGTFVSFTLFAVAQTRIQAAETTLGFFTAPIWTALFGWWLLRERIPIVFVPAVGLLLAGGTLALDLQGARPDTLGVILATGSGVTWGLYSVLLRRHAADVPWRLLLAGAIMLSAPLFLLVAAAAEPMPDWAQLSARTWRWTGIQVAVPTLLSLGLFQAALQRTRAATVNLFVGLELAGTVLLAWVLLGETYGASELAGLVLVLGAVTGYLAMAPGTPGPPGDSSSA